MALGLQRDRPAAEHLLAILDQLLGILVEDMGIEYVKKRNEWIEALTVDDLKRAAARFLKPEELIVVVVGKPKGLAPKG